MAKEDDKARDDEEEREESAPASAGLLKDLIGRLTGNKWALLGALAGLFVLLSIVATAALLLLNRDDSEKADRPRPVAPAEQTALYYALQPAFVANFDVRGRQRFLQVEVTLMFRDSRLVPEIELHMPAIRNSLVMLFAGQIYEDLQTPEGKELLRQQALMAVQAVLEQEAGRVGIEQVLFTSFVMQ